MVAHGSSMKRCKGALTRPLFLIFYLFFHVRPYFFVTARIDCWVIEKNKALQETKKEIRWSCKHLKSYKFK